MGNPSDPWRPATASTGLNESPSEKVGKFQLVAVPVLRLRLTSMKALPKWKGNTGSINRHYQSPAPQ